MVLLAITDIYFLRVELSPCFTVLQVFSRPGEWFLVGFKVLSDSDMQEGEAWKLQ